VKAASVESGDDKGSLLDGRYVLLEKLGEGGRGIVYKALDNLLDRVIALKVLKGEGLDEEAYTRFMREAQAAARLSHTNVVAIYDVGEDSGRHFLVVEYVDGQTLRDLLQERRAGRLDPASLLRIAREVCRALEYAHSRGILHRDIKPENIMITRDGTAKLMDFGLARALDQPHVTPSGVMVGTPTYMSPENALGKESDARSDLYSLGAVLYEMATGQPPFPEEDSLKVIYRHIHDEPVAPSRLNPDLPVGLEELILRLLQKDPSRRYRSASDLLRVLREVEQSEGGEEVRPEEPSPPAETGEAKRVPTPEPRRTLRLVDREIELERLKAYLDGVLRGDGSVVLLAGEAGIGKTRLAEELKAYATLRGARWLVGRCFEKEGIMPFAPWAQILREIVRETPRQLLYRVSEGYANELAKLVPEIIDKIGPVPSIATEDPSQERFRLFEGVTQVFLRLSQEAPLILFLDDLNWADPASLELFLYVARNVSGRFLLVVGAFRDVELEEDTALSSMLLDLNRDRLLNSIRLERLDASQVAQMIGETFGEEDVSGEFLALIFEKTGGNQSAAARLLHISRDALRYKMKKYNFL
jgi:DNA-binding protein Fis/predicted Ser/Thr protein kinase